MTITNIPVKHRQTVGYGCGHHALANLFNDPKILGDIIPERASWDWMLNDSVQRHVDEDMTIEVMLKVNDHVDQPMVIKDPSIFKITWDGDDRLTRDYQQNWFRSFLMVFKRSGERAHLVLVVQPLDSNKLYVVDSLEEFILETTIEEIFNEYHVLTLFEFSRKSFAYNDRIDTVIFRRESYSHII